MKTTKPLNAPGHAIPASSFGLRGQAERDPALAIEPPAGVPPTAPSSLRFAGAAQNCLRLATVCVGCVVSSALAAEISLESAPPVVVKTAPVAGATDVDPTLTEIRVTFSKPMQDGSWSWSTWGEENFPEMVGQPRYLADGRTCVATVKLQPGRFYATWLNSDKFKNFKDAAGRAAVPYLLTFTTAADGVQGTRAPAAIIAEAVATISQSAEGDPRVADALAKLRAVPEPQAVTGLISYLDSTQDTVRRAAIYILWRGNFKDITPAIAPLQKLLDHSEDLTRGMAALALGQNKAGASLEALMKMARKDKSGYARRCAAYALGLLGDGRAEPALKAALNDTEVMVRNNAQAALDMLKATKSLSPPASKFSDRSSAVFTPVVETVLKSPERRVAELLDVDTGQRATSTNFGENDRETHAWIREYKLDLLGVVERGQIAVLCHDVVVPPAPAKSFDNLTAEQVRTNWHLAQGEPNKITALSPATDQTDTWYFRTREDGYGILQILGENADPPGVKIRYKLVQTSAGSGAGASDTFLTLLNDDQRAVLAWTDRQFRSFFDARTFEGWSAEERAALEKKLMDALNGPRSTEYYQAINSLAALRSAKALPRLREIAHDRADKNNRDRWMAIRALGMIGEKADVPELIHLVYHGNQNTHWWAQISLVRLTGQNFGGDWNAWGQWWNKENGQPPYQPEIIRWWNGQPEPDKLADALAESDAKFLDGIKPK